MIKKNIGKIKPYRILLLTFIIITIGFLVIQDYSRLTKDFSKLRSLLAKVRSNAIQNDMTLIVQFKGENVIVKKKGMF